MRLISSAALWWVILAGGIAFLPVLVLLPRQELFEMVNGAIMAVGVGVFVGFGRAAWDILRLPIHRVSAAEILVVGIVICAKAVVVIFCGLWWWRVAGKPDWLEDHAMLAFARWEFAGGAMLVLAAASSEDGLVGLRSYRRTGAFAAAGVLVTAALISLGYR